MYEYLLQVPANRIGHTAGSLGQLKIVQDIITLIVFIPFCRAGDAAAAPARLPLGRPLHGWRGLLRLTWNYVAGALYTYASATR